MAQKKRASDAQSLNWAGHFAQDKREEPVDSLRQNILDMIQAQRTPMQPDDVAHRLDHVPEEVRQVMNELAAEGALMQTKRKAYGLPEQLGCVTGTLRATASGAAFLVPAQGDDYYVSSDGRSGAMHNDFVLARIIKGAKEDRRGEAEVLEVLRRSTATVVGVYRRVNGGGVVSADDRKLGLVFIPEGAERGAWDGSKVVVAIARYADDRRDAEGKITEVLGDQGETEAEILSIIRALGLRDAFPPQVRTEADAVPRAIAAEELASRRDLREELIVTIDGADAKDLDDAVDIRRLENGNLRLGVHIADVSHYVKTGGAIDNEAWKRGTSVYLLNTVLPMLPERLSNGICSLHPGEDRLTLSCVMELDGRGKVVGSDVFESVIRSHARLTYDEVNAILEQQDPETMERRQELVEPLRLMDELRETLRERRMARGAIDLDIDEPHILLDESGVPLEVTARYRGRAHKLIEEFMLCANEAVALYLEQVAMPVLFRIHEPPDAERMGELAVFLRNLGYNAKGLRGDVHPKALQSVINEVRDTRHENIIARIMLRSMKKARYSTQNLGHFGLAARHYCHFTSPIRRYPDLMVHRMIRSALRGQSPAQYALTAEPAAVQSSEMERKAMDAERAVDDLKMTEYMAAHVGEEFEGVISGVTEFGVFVELPNLIEGLIRMSELTDDYYDLDKANYALVGRRRRRPLALGDSLRVRVLRVDVAARQIDFSLAGDRPIAVD